jgi:hypothetical protein
MERILTVIEGAGIDLETPRGVLMARHMAPVAFHGELPVHGRLVAGPIRDLNLIYDPSRLRASVDQKDGPAETRCTGAFHCIRGQVAAGSQAVLPGAFALGEDFSLTLAAGASGLIIALREVRARK